MYASPAHDIRKKLWMELDAIKYDIQGPWVSIGDFNAVVRREDMSNPESFNARRCSGFRDWIATQGLVDLGYSRAPFTWSRGTREGCFRRAHLDRALANIDWCNKFKNTSIIIYIQRVSSDHASLLLKFEQAERHGRGDNFKFQAMWLTHPNFQEVIRNVWKEEIDIRYHLRGVKMGANLSFHLIFSRQSQI